MIEKDSNDIDVSNIVPVTRDAQIYFKRLTDLVVLRRQMDSKDFPIAYYGEIPIRGEKHGVKGLRFGVFHAIAGSYSILDELGYGPEAKAMLEFGGSDGE